MRITAKNFEKLIDRRVVYKPCVWPVALCAYQVLGDYISTKETKPSNPSGWFISYPLEYPDLFLSFAELGDSNKESGEDMKKLKGWVDRFGLLFKAGGAPNTFAIESGYGEGDSVIANAATEMKLDDFLAHAKQASDLLKLYKDVRSAKADRIWRRVSESGSPLDNLLRDRVVKADKSDKAPKKPIQPSSEQEREHYLWHAAWLLSEQLTECLSDMRLVADIGDLGATVNHLGSLMNRRLRGECKPDSWPAPPFEPPHHLVGSWGCPDLLSAIYFQFHLFVTRRNPERRCKNPACGQLFTPTNARDIYCGVGCRSTGRNYRS